MGRDLRCHRAAVGLSTFGRVWKPPRSTDPRSDRPRGTNRRKRGDELRLGGGGTVSRIYPPLRTGCFPFEEIGRRRLAIQGGSRRQVCENPGRSQDGGCRSVASRYLDSECLLEGPCGVMLVAKGQDKSLVQTDAPVQRVCVRESSKEEKKTLKCVPAERKVPTCIPKACKKLDPK